MYCRYLCKIKSYRKLVVSFAIFMTIICEMRNTECRYPYMRKLNIFFALKFGENAVYYARQHVHLGPVPSFEHYWPILYYNRFKKSYIDRGEGKGFANLTKFKVTTVNFFQHIWHNLINERQLFETELKNDHLIENRDR